MKRNNISALILLLISTTIFAQLGTTTFNTASDNASNYGSTWSNGTNLGTGFSTWSLSSSGGGSYLGVTGQDSGTGFGLYSDGTNNFSSAVRNLISDLKMGETISVNIGHTSTINGEVFLQLLDDGNAVFTLKFVGGTSAWQINDGGNDFTITQNYSANTSLTFSFTYNEDGTYSYSFGASNGNNYVATSLISGINAIKFQSSNQGASNNFGFNNLTIDSKYTISGNSTVASDANIIIPYLDIQTGSTLNIGTASGIQITGDLTVNGTLNINSESSLRVAGSSIGEITYKVNVGTAWHLVSSPVNGETYDDAWNTANNVTSGTGSNMAVSTYNNTVPSSNWDYYQSGGMAINFDSGIGYALKRTAAGDYSYTGTYVSGTINPTITQSSNNWNLIGNPYTSYIDIDALLTANTSNITAAYDAIYVWDSTLGTSGEYTSKTTGYIQPGQAFFINSNIASGTASITEAMQSHQTGVTFYKTNKASINLSIHSGTNTSTTTIDYLATKTTGLDRRYDIGTFTGAASAISVYTHLVTDSNGIDLMRQALPLNYEKLIVPIGVNAPAGEITFTVDTQNIPEGLKVFIEDTSTGIFTRLDIDNSNYTITLTDTSNDIGRFYLHTSTSDKSVLAVSDQNLNDIHVYASKNTLYINGARNGKIAVKLFSILGTVVLEKSLTATGNNSLELSPSISKGVYIVSIETTNGTINQKIILQ